MTYKLIFIAFASHFFLNKGNPHYGLLDLDGTTNSPYKSIYQALYKLKASNYK